MLGGEQKFGVETSSVETIVSGEQMEALIVELRQLSVKRKQAESARRDAGMNATKEVLDAYKKVNEQFHAVLKEVKDAEAQLKKEGWITSERGGFKIDLTESKSGNKIFKVVDLYGDVPVSIGQTFQARLDAQNMIPESIRASIINQFVYGEDRIATERYSDIPEGDTGEIDKSFSSETEYPDVQTQVKEDEKEEVVKNKS